MNEIVWKSVCSYFVPFNIYLQTLIKTNPPPSIIYKISLKYNLEINLVRSFAARNSWWYEKLTFKSIDIIFSGDNGCEFSPTTTNDTKNQWIVLCFSM